MELKEFEATAEGIIQSHIEYRIREDTYDNALELLWQKDRHYWN